MNEVDAVELDVPCADCGHPGNCCGGRFIEAEALENVVATLRHIRDDADHRLVALEESEVRARRKR